MRRYFFIAEKLEDIEKVESSMKMQGFADNQYHVLSNDDSNAEKRRLHDVSSILKQDVVHSAEMGAMVGAGVAVFILLLAWLAGWASGPFGWAPFIALALLAFCFCTWEGAFLGIQIPNRQFRRFNRILQEGKHVFFVDLDESQFLRFEPVMRLHPELKEAGADIGWPRWLQRSSHNVKEMIKALP